MLSLYKINRDIRLSSLLGHRRDLDIRIPTQDNFIVGVYVRLTRQISGLGSLRNINLQYHAALLRFSVSGVLCVLFSLVLINTGGHERLIVERVPYLS